MADLYNSIGVNYNTTRHADPYLTERFLHFLQAGPGKSFLDIGCGTGNYTIALAQNGVDITGVDPSDEMLNVARSRNLVIKWLKGYAEEIPAADGTYDGVMAMLTIHHWKSIPTAMQEIYRVIKPRGVIVLFTAMPPQMKCYWLNHYFPQMTQSSYAQMPGFYDMASALAKAGFNLDTAEKYFVKPDLQDNFLYAGKYKPEIYFDEEIRKGISSFAALSDTAEVEQGLAKLKADIESGEFENIRDESENRMGDYSFIVANK